MFIDEHEDYGLEILVYVIMHHFVSSPSIRTSLTKGQLNHKYGVILIVNL